MVTKIAELKNILSSQLDINNVKNNGDAAKKIKQKSANEIIKTIQNNEPLNNKINNKVIENNNKNFKSSESNTIITNTATAAVAIDVAVNNTDTQRPPIIKLREKKNIQKKTTLPATTMQLIESNDSDIQPSMNNTNGFLQSTIESFHDTIPDVEDNTEEIRKLDSQLDHLNEYMGKVEERLKTHNEKLMQALKQQKEEREKRRRSFHERLDANRQEDDNFQRQLSQILDRVDISRKRESAYEYSMPLLNNVIEKSMPNNNKNY